MSSIKPVSIIDFLDLFEKTKNGHLALNEPIPDLNKSNISFVTSCLNSPFHTAYGIPIYKTFIQKAAILFYLLIKNHPLQNGNKRMAVVTIEYFCEINNKSLNIDNTKFFQLALFTANSNDKSFCIKTIELFLKDYIS